MRGWPLWATGLAGAMICGMAVAQTGLPAAPPSVGGVSSGTILTLDQDRLFSQSAYGKAVKARAAAAEASLAAENRRIEAGLEQEERDLTERRSKMEPAEFAKLADAFDAKVEAIRTAQDAKSREITQRRDGEQQRFVQVAGPILGKLMTETGAVAIIDKSVLILSLSSIDITEAAVARLDAVLGDGTALPAPEAAPSPDAAEPPAGSAP